MTRMESLSLKNIQAWYEKEISRFPLAQKGQEGLRAALFRTLEADGMTFTLQHNPQRAISTLAKVDRDSIKERPCFLCRKNRPEEQASLMVLDHYEILVNPFPIFPFHLTIPDVSHQAQSIQGRLQDLLSLSHLLKGCTVFYNGPLSGASAPDHMHFQAVGKDLTSICLQSAKEPRTILEELDLSVKVETTLRHGFIIQSTDKKKAQLTASRLIDALPLSDGQTEPMMNLLTCCQGKRWTLILIGRRRHRPECYFREDESRLMVSPASVDLSGCLVLPLREDFERMTSPDLQGILQEVCLTDAMVDDAIVHFKKT